jgi:hypothetical protein
MISRRRLARLNSGREETMKNRLVGAALLAVVASALLAGCASYYRVTDPTSGRQYYTKDFERGRDGSVTFQDGKTRSAVTLQNSEVSEVTKSEFEVGIAAQ